MLSGFLCTAVIVIIAYVLHAYTQQDGSGDMQRKMKNIWETAAKHVKTSVPSAPQAKFARNMADHEKHPNCLVTGVAYSGYEESLRTLHRSGLVTTAEMHELLEKHNL